MPCLYHRGNIRELFTSSHIIKAPMNRHLDTFLQRKLKIYDHQLASRGRRLMFVRKELNTRPAFEPPTVYSFLRKTASMPRPLWGWGCPLFAWQLSFSLIKIYCSSVTMGGGAGGGRWGCQTPVFALRTYWMFPWVDFMCLPHATC